MDLSKLSTEDLLALKAGDLSKVSTAGLQSLRGSQAADRVNNDEISQGARSFAKEGVSGKVLSTVGGLVRGAGSIGATLMRPFESGEENQQRRASMDAALSDLGADTDSMLYKGGKLGAEVAGTLGVGGALAAPVKALGAGPLSNAIASGLQTGGFRVAGMTGVPGLAARIGTGAATGAASAGLVDPNAAGAGAVIGGALPPAVQVAGKVGQAVSNGMQSGARRLMQSAIKPTLAQLKSGDAATAVDVMLEKGISPNKGGVEKLQGLIDDSDNALAAAIQNSTAQIPKPNALAALSQTRQQFAQQSVPQADLAAIDAAEQAFMAHPNYPGQWIPVQDAQALKQGTYKVLAKKYGQVGTADTEAQKAIARGLKDEIAHAVPEVGPINADLSRYLSTLGVIERRARMEGNKNLLGLGAVAPNTAGFAAFLADRNALLKALAARGMNAAAQPTGNALASAANPAVLPYVRAAVLANEANP